MDSLIEVQTYKAKTREDVAYYESLSKHIADEKLVDDNVSYVHEHVPLETLSFVSADSLDVQFDDIAINDDGDDVVIESVENVCKCFKNIKFNFIHFKQPSTILLITLSFFSLVRFILFICSFFILLNLLEFHFKIFFINYF